MRLLLLVTILACTTTGCVSRRLTVRSNPPGALVELDGERIGFTPVSVDFTYYATRELRLSKVGYETLTVEQPLRPPWYQVPPLDFVSDNFLLHQVTDRHDVTYSLQRQRANTTVPLIDRANTVRAGEQGGG